jgi:hypothetical protein
VFYGRMINMVSPVVMKMLNESLMLKNTPANLVLTQTIERLFHSPSKSYAQMDRGVFLIRGENVVLLGEIVSHWQTNRVQIRSGRKKADVGTMTGP